MPFEYRFPDADEPPGEEGLDFDDLPHHCDQCGRKTRKVQYAVWTCDHCELDIECTGFTILGTED